MNQFAVVHGQVARLEKDLHLPGLVFLVPVRDTLRETQHLGSRVGPQPLPVRPGAVSQASVLRIHRVHCQPHRQRRRIEIDVEIVLVRRRGMIGPGRLVEPLGFLRPHRFAHQRLGQAHERFPCPVFHEERVDHVLHLLERLGRLPVLEEGVRVGQRGNDLGDIPVEFSSQLVEALPGKEVTDDDKTVSEVILPVPRVLLDSRRGGDRCCIVNHETNRLKNSCRSWASSRSSIRPSSMVSPINVKTSFAASATMPISVSP